MPITGLDHVRRNVTLALGKIAGPLAEKTLQEVLIVAGASAASMTPMDTGNLSRSQYRRIEPGNGKVTAMLGYTAAYAAAVHARPGTLKGKDRPGGRGVYWGPSGEPQFLTKAFEENRDAIDFVVARGMKI